MVSGFCPPISSSLLPNSQLRVTIHPLPPCPSPSWGQVPSWGQLGWQAVTGEEGEPWTGPRLESKEQGLECGPLLSPTFPTHPHPKPKASQHPFLSEVPVFSPLCDGQDGQRGKYITSNSSSGSGPHSRNVYSGDRDPLDRGHFPRDRIFGALLRKACSSSSWRTQRSYP